MRAPGRAPEPSELRNTDPPEDHIQVGAEGVPGFVLRTGGIDPGEGFQYGVLGQVRIVQDTDSVGFGAFPPPEDQFLQGAGVIRLHPLHQFPVRDHPLHLPSSGNYTPGKGKCYRYHRDFSRKCQSNFKKKTGRGAG